MNFGKTGPFSNHFGDFKTSQYRPTRISYNVNLVSITVSQFPLQYNRMTRNQLHLEMLAFRILYSLGHFLSGYYRGLHHEAEVGSRCANTLGVELKMKRAGI